MDNKEVKRLANLSRLKLTEKEIETFSSQLSNIFNFFEELKKLPVEDVPLVSFANNNFVREDEVLNEPKSNNFFSKEKLKNGYVKIKSVLGKAT